MLLLNARALRGRSALQARGLWPRPCFRLCAPSNRSLPVPTSLAAMDMRRSSSSSPSPTPTYLADVGVDESSSPSSGGWRGVWLRLVLTVPLVARAPCLERPTRSLSNSWALLSLSMHRVYTDRVCVFTDSPDFDRVVTQEAGTVATVETMPFAGFMRPRRPRPGHTFRLVAGPRRTPLVGLSRAVADPKRRRGDVRCSTHDFPTSVWSGSAAL